MTSTGKPASWRCAARAGLAGQVLESGNRIGLADTASPYGPLRGMGLASAYHGRVALRGLARPEILHAVAAYDERGPDRFLREHEFGEKYEIRPAPAGPYPRGRA